MPFWTARCSFFSLANVEIGGKKIFEIFFPLTLSFSLPRLDHSLTPPIPACPATTTKEEEGHALHLDKVWWTSPPTAYKNRGEKRKKRGNRERERDKELFGEKQGDRNREKKQRQKRRGRATTAGCCDTNATRSTNTAALPNHSQPSLAHHLPPTRCCTIEEKAATCASTRGRRRRKPLLSSGFPATATFITTVRHRQIPLHHHQHHR